MSAADSLKKYAGLYARHEILSTLSLDTSASAFLLGGEDADGLCVLARLVAARLCGLPLDRAFDDYADIAVYPKPPEIKKSSSKSKKSGSAEKQKRAAVTVDDIRDIVGSLYLTPFELPKRIYIIEGAESMSDICQNKLLKSLEEPPRHCSFILCAAGRLLPTVESRCKRVEMPPFSVSTVADELSKFHKDGKAVALAARASRGNLGMAEKMLADSGFGATYAAALDILRTADGSRTFGRTAAIYDKFTREKTDAVLGIMEYLFADIARYAIGVDTVFDVSDVKSVAAGYTAYSAASCADFVREARRRNDGNCMPVAVMDTAVLKIMEEKAKCQR